MITAKATEKHLFDAYPLPMIYRDAGTAELCRVCEKTLVDGNHVRSLVNCVRALVNDVAASITKGESRSLLTAKGMGLDSVNGAAATEVVLTYVTEECQRLRMDYEDRDGNERSGIDEVLDSLEASLDRVVADLRAGYL